MMSPCLLLVVIFLTEATLQNKALYQPVRWTPWYNSDQPDGVGDMEKLSTIRHLHSDDVCREPVHIEVRTRGGVHVRDTDQTVHYSPTAGFWCLNEEQIDGKCLDYKVRFLCTVDQSNPGQPTAKDSHQNVTIDRKQTEAWDNQEDMLLNWSTWSPCDVSCGGIGIQKRGKRCRQENNRPQKCNSREIEETRPCGDKPCQTNMNQCETSGVVTDTTNIPLQGVEIVLGTMSGRSFTILTATDEAGYFYIHGICADSKFAHLVARKKNYVTTRVHLKVNSSGNAVANARLMTAVFPTIYKHPVNKARLFGQSVRFCCKARGSSKELVYSWYHNGSLLDVSLYSRDPGSLEIRNLNLEHVGEYWCQVTSLATSKKVTSISQSAYLSVFNTESSACDETPKPNFIKLPPDCKTDSMFTKRTGNATYFNVGFCSTEICPTQILASGGCGETSSRQCCTPVERKEILVNCGEYRLPIQTVLRCGCQECVKPIIKVQGKAYGSDLSEPLRFGFIYLGNKKLATTSYDGDFTVDVPDGSKRLVLTFSDRFGKLVTTTKVLTFKEKGGVVFHRIKMARKSPEKIFNSREASAVKLSGTSDQESVAQLITGPNTFYTKEGRQYTGKIRASVTFIDPRNETSYQEAPSDLTFADNNGETLPLTTYGMFEMDFRDDDQNQLNVGKAKIVLDANQIASPSHIRNMKLWSLNPENGLWEEEDNFQVVADANQKSDTPKRRKREDRTFLIGNLEIRERRLYNLDVPAENRCWIKVRAYRSPEFIPEEQVEGVEVTVINMEPEAGFRGNPQAWGRFDTELTAKNGACVRVLCHSAKPDAYKAIVIAKLDASEELYPAPSTFPPDPRVIGVQGEILKKLEYQRSDHNEASGKKTSFQTNLPKPKPGTKLQGPIYPEENFRDCENAPVTDNHFRFYRTEDFLYEFNTIYMDEHDCLTWTPHYLNWWPKPLEYRACYIKVHITSQVGTVVRVKSFGGTHPETKDKLYGIRDDRSVTISSDNEKDFTHESAACVEFKCSGMLYDMDVPDRTLVTVVPQGECRLHRLNEKLTQYLTEHPPTVESESRSEFRMFAPADPLGHNYGIYTVTDDDPLIAKKTAIGRCYAGSSDVTSKIMNARRGVAIYYQCANENIDEELP